QVILYGYDGNDIIDLTTVKNDATIYDGAGNDIIRCGTGNDLIPGGTGFDQVYRTYNPLTPIVDGTSESDIQQGQNPLCQTDASLGELAQQGHNFSSDIQYLGNHWYYVKLHGAAAQKVYFDGWTNNNDVVTSSNGEFWMVLMQRARLQSLGIDPSKSYMQSQWDAMNKATNNRLYSVADAMYTFTGNAAVYTSMAFANPASLQYALSHGNAVVAQSRAGGGAVTSDGIIVNHAYAVTSVYYEGGTWKVRLYNPWGMDRENGSTVDAADKSNPPANDGFITVTWQQFVSSNNFVGYFVAKK
ncbi:MAG TPA: C2 family cysteine protease, partial [Gemmataceae bacterium]|nr:C2 family cysteine protease [Gemmataceae bacterium]